MTRDEIIRMAREADREWDCDRDTVVWLEWFAALVAAAEREACAKVCEMGQHSEYDGHADCAAAIRARGNV